MNKDSVSPKEIHQIMPEEVQRLHGNKFSIDTARKRISKVIKAKGLSRRFITMGEYSEHYELPINEVLNGVK